MRAEGNRRLRTTGLVEKSTVIKWAGKQRAESDLVTATEASDSAWGRSRHSEGPLRVFIQLLDSLLLFPDTDVSELARSTHWPWPSACSVLSPCVTTEMWTTHRAHEMTQVVLDAHTHWLRPQLHALCPLHPWHVGIFGAA